MRLGFLSVGPRGAITVLALALALSGGLIANPASAREVPGSFADLVEKYAPTVVNISITQKQAVGKQGLPEGFPQLPPGSPFEDFFRDFFERQQRQNGQPRAITSLGSGFIIDARGYIVTNNHVIADADEVKVILNDDTELVAKVIGRDSKTDIAVVKVDTKRSLPVATWGDSDRARVGDWVLAIGNPFGLGGSVTAGIISARGRNIRSGPYDDFIQTDASINKGNSGGPLFSTNGDVVGVTTAIFSQTGGSIGIGFAVPASLAKPVVDQLIQYGRTRRGWLGVKIQTVTDDIADSLGLDKSRGALVAGVNEGGPAAKGGIEPGDVIVAFDNKPISNMNSLPRLVAETPIGREAPVELWRKGRKVNVKVMVGELQETEETAEAAPASAPSGGAIASEKKIDLLGLKVAPVNDDMRGRFDLDPDINGVVITDVAADGPAAGKDIRPGDVIVEVGQSSVKTPDDVIARVKEARDGKRRSALLLVMRGGDRRFIAVPFKS